MRVLLQKSRLAQARNLIMSHLAADLRVRDRRRRLLLHTLQPSLHQRECERACETQSQVQEPLNRHHSPQHCSCSPNDCSPYALSSFLIFLIFSSCRRCLAASPGACWLQQHSSAQCDENTQRRKRFEPWPGDQVRDSHAHENAWTAPISVQNVCNIVYRLVQRSVIKCPQDRLGIPTETHW